MKDLLKKLKSREAPLGVVGLGYVGLPLACLFAEKYRVVGFDIKKDRVEELKKGLDRTREVEDKAKLLNPNITYTCDATSLANCPVIIVAVPTPIDNFKVPDLTPVVGASKTVGKHMTKGTIVVYESTVYPGLTETTCGKLLEEQSGMKCGRDFFLGYSPERVNPGDKKHTIDKIVKVVSGQTPEVLDVLAEVYGSVIPAGVHRAPSMATAEAAKVLENTQRDINIALVNELAMLCERIGLDTNDVLEAASTKWNFLNFRPGLVGGHCIGVDPYYLTHLASSVNFHPQAILAGRRINDGMGKFIGEKLIRLCLNAGKKLEKELKIAILGVTFKENVPDLRNSKVLDIVETLETFGAKIYLFDPIADPEEFHEEYGRKLVNWKDIPACDAMILAVKHNIFLDEYPLKRLVEKMNGTRIIADVKAMIDRKEARDMGVTVWRL